MDRLRQRADFLAVANGARANVRSGVDRYRGIGGQTFYYLSADEYHGGSWVHLRMLNMTFNLILSDAMHRTSALIMEWEELVNVPANRNAPLLDITGSAEWTMLWDDLHEEGMIEGYNEILQDCRIRTSNSPGVTIYDRLVTVNGWIGQHQLTKHRIGLLSNRPLTFVDDIVAYAASIAN